MKAKDKKLHDLPKLAEIDRVIHEPARLMILGYLSAVDGGEFLFLMNQTKLTRGNLSSHLSKLEEAGYVTIQKEFVNKIPRTLIKLTERGRDALGSYLAQMNSVFKGLAP
ncbi:transcriptional regulator [bacterium]|nr:transcriptional regulator [bacterium]MBU1881162.1 transcriptional regulator [bacterium]